MKIDKKTIVVPWDFSPRAEDALAHAIRIANHMQNNIVLLNVAENSSKVDDLKAKLAAEADKYLAESGIEYTSEVITGSIFSGISEFANKNKVNMVIMGTHGIKGMQKITGSWALKVISGSQVPFIVVQDKPVEKEKPLTDIVFPIDFTSETKEKINWAVFLGKYFNSKIHIFKYPVSDPSLSNKVNVNMNFAIRFLKQQEIEYDVSMGKKSSNFGKESLQYAQDIDADLLLIMTKKNLNFSVLGAPEQYLIANGAKVPVMCINPHINYADWG